MKRLWIISLGFLMASMASCQPSTPEQSPREDAVAMIDSLESVLKAAEGDLDSALGLTMVRRYAEYATAYPEDTMALRYWYRAGEVARNIPGMELYAVTYYANIHQEHPEHALADEAIFMTGVSFDQLGDEERAKKTFTYFLDTYPEHPWASDARAMLDIYSQPLDSQVQEWLEKAKQNN